MGYPVLCSQPNSSYPSFTMSVRRADLSAGGGGPTVSTEDMRARLAMVTEQVDFALAEVALRGAAYRRAAQDAADWQWPPESPQNLSRPVVARALLAQLTAVARLRLWAQELYWLQEQVRLRAMVP